MPPRRRDSPASLAAAVRVGQLSRMLLAGVPTWVSVRGSNREVPASMVTLAPKLSLPVNLARMAAAAELKVLCPDTYSGNGGLTTLGDW